MKNLLFSLVFAAALMTQAGDASAHRRDRVWIVLPGFGVVVDGQGRHHPYKYRVKRGNNAWIWYDGGLRRSHHPHVWPWVYDMPNGSGGGPQGN